MCQLYIFSGCIENYKNVETENRLNIYPKEIIKSIRKSVTGRAGLYINE